MNILNLRFTPPRSVSVLKLGSATLFSLTLYYIWHIWNSYKFFKKRGLKTPPFRFLIGNFAEFLKDNKQSETLQKWTQLYGKTYGYYEGHTPVLVSSDLDFIQEVFVKQYSNFSAKKHKTLDRPDSSSMVNLIQATKSRWKRQRNIMNPTFSNAKLRQLSPTMLKCIDQYMADLEVKDTAELNITELLKNVAGDIIWNCALNTDTGGLEESKIQKYRKNVVKSFKDFLKMTTTMYLATYFSEFRNTFVSFHLLYNWLSYKLTRNDEIMDPVYWLREESIEILHHRRKNNVKRNDYLQLLMDAEVDNSFKDDKSTQTLSLGQLNIEKKLTTDEIKMNIALFMMAGYETTSSTLSRIFWILAKYPEEQQKLYEEISLYYPCTGNPEYDKEPEFEDLEKLEYINMFIKETLRLYPIGNASITRRCMVPTTVKGIDIPENLVIAVDVFSIHNDPDVWGPMDPAKFYPERFSKEHKRHPASFLGFGLGPRNCIGMKFAYIEMKFILAKILRKYEILSCDKTVDELRFVEGVAIRTAIDDVIVSIKKRY